jgi:hypothetical protein
VQTCLLCSVGPTKSWRVFQQAAKAGCNLGGCHGNGQGKGGLKLSLRGQDPDLDWLALTRDQAGRRVNAVEPEKSLLLLKATGAVPHEGGKRFAPGSPEHAVMTSWRRHEGKSGAAARHERHGGLPRVDPPEHRGQ